MGVQEGGLTLEGLANRLEALERENTELRDEVTALRASGTRRDKLAEKRGSETHLEGEPVAVLERRVSRRSLLSKAGAAAVAAAAAGTLLYPRQARANHMGEPFIGDYVITHSLTATQDVADRRAIDCTNNSVSAGFATIEALNNGSGAAVNGQSKGSGPAVVGKGGTTGVQGIGGSLAAGTGVKGRGATGVEGYSPNSEGTGVLGLSPGTGVVGSSGTGGTGVSGSGGTGVSGKGTDVGQAGVKGQGPTGVWGLSSKTSYSGVYGEHTGTSGHGTVGIGKGGDAGVLGRNPSGEGVRGEGSVGVRGDGQIGVRGESTSSSSVGVLGRNDGGTGVQGDGKNGVFGRGSSGYGGFFEGGKAQLRLWPAGSAGKPIGAHSAGEIYMDSAGSLFVCVVGGNPAKWRKVSTTAV